MIVYKEINNGYRDLSTVFDVPAYIFRDKKRGYVMNRYSGGLHIYDLKNTGSEFMMVKRYFGKMSGRQVKHFVVSFDRSDRSWMSPDEAFDIGVRVCQYYFGRNQIAFSVHTDTDNLHIHFCVNTVSFVDGKKLHEDYYDICALKNHCVKCYNSVKSLRFQQCRLS